MKLEDLKPGRYILTEDVRNPHPDRRVSRYQYGDWRKWETIPCTWKFLVRLDGCKTFLELYAEERSISQSIVLFERPEGEDFDNHGALLNALLQYLQPIAHDIGSILADAGFENWHSPILDQLEKMGKITLEDVREALRLETE